MATHVKTVEYFLGTLKNIANNTLTSFSSSVIFLPEKQKKFKSVTLIYFADDIVTATGGTITVRDFSLALDANARTFVSNSTTFTHSGENISHYHTTDWTSYFNASWSAALPSMSCNVQFKYNQSTGTTLGFTNANANLVITYEYESTSSYQQVKTVRIPIDPKNSGSMPIVKSTWDLIPALDTYLPESTKSYYDINLTLQGNTSLNASTTNQSMSIQVDSLAIDGTGAHAGALATDRFFRYISPMSGVFDTSTPHSCSIWSSIATRYNHIQGYMTVTYGFNATSSTAAINSLLLPMDFDSPMGGSSSVYPLNASRELLIQEPNNVGCVDSAFYMFFEQPSAVTGLSARIGSGTLNNSYITFTDIASTLGGGNALMLKSNNITLSRGRNTLACDVYRTGIASNGWNVSGFWLINYTSSIAPSGIDSHNHTIIDSYRTIGSRNVVNIEDYSLNNSSSLPSKYFITAAGSSIQYISNTTSTPAGVVVQTWTTQSTDGPDVNNTWVTVYKDISNTDPEVGLRQAWAQARTLYDRWPQDPDGSRFNFTIPRNWKIIFGNAATAFVQLWFVYTYHSITSAISGAIAGSSGGSVGLNVYRTSLNDLILTGSVVGNASYSFEWYDNTETIFIAAKENNSYVGRSGDYTASYVG